jgi:AraC-like DNA-binding protein
LILITLISALYLSSLLIFLLKKRSNKNKFHLDYLLLHLATLLLLILAIIVIVYYKITNYSLLNTLNVIHIVMLIFLILHVESAVMGRKVKINFYYFVPIGIYLIVNILNYKGIYILDFNSRSYMDFLGIKGIDFNYYSDKKIVKILVTLPLVLYLMSFLFVNIKKSSFILSKKTYSIWIYSFCFICLLSFISTFLYYYEIIDSKYDNTLIILTQYLWISKFLSIAINPFILSYLPLINNSLKPVFENDLLVFGKIKNLFNIEKIYLDHNLNLRKVSSNLGLTENEIRELIKINTQENFNDFVNRHRIEYSIVLIQSAFLKNNSIVSLGKKSGFGSIHTFLRAFKKLMNTTPSKFYKSIKKPK